MKFARWLSFLWNSSQKADLSESFQFEDSVYPPTQEIYGSKAGSIQWKKASIQFCDPQLITKTSSSNKDQINE